MNSIILQTIQHQLSSQNSIWLLMLVFLGGVVTSISPCTLGMLPVVVGYVGGNAENKTKKIVFQVICFVLGLSLALTSVGVISAFTGKALGFQSSPVWALILASLIMIMGLSLMELIEIPVPVLIKSLPTKKNTGFLYPIILGATFAFATTPCSTPILAGIMAYASLKSNLILGALLLFIFSLGQGLVLILAGIFTSMFKKLTVLKTCSGHFVKFSGFILVLASVFIFAKIF